MANEKSMDDLRRRGLEQINKIQLSGARVDDIFDDLAQRVIDGDREVDAINNALEAGTYDGKVQSDADWTRAMIEDGMDPALILRIWDRKEDLGRDRRDKIHP